MDVKKVLYISQEIDPYLTGTPLGVFSRELSQGLQEKGAEVRAFMPKYGAITERRNQLHEVIRLSGMNIIVDDTDHPLIIKVATLQPTRLQVYFIDNDDFFYRHNSAKHETVDWADINDERTIFFVRGTIETVRKLRWGADIVHCAGWITALTPLYIKVKHTDDLSFRSSKIVFSLFNDNFEGTLDHELVRKLKEDGFTDNELKALTTGEGDVDYIKLNKLAIDYADAIIQSAADVAPELIAYAKASGKLFLPYSEDKANAEAYKEFYTSL